MGSNLGDRAENLRGARERLAVPDTLITRASSIYETAPRDVLDQPPFLNQVVELETSLAPEELLARLLTIEKEMGRQRTQVGGPRIVDLDILLYGDAVHRTAALEIPHPRMTGRRFVLEPLVELAPEVRHPLTRRTARELLANVMDQPVRRWDL